jgi:hypothetical protein
VLSQSALGTFIVFLQLVFVYLLYRWYLRRPTQARLLFLCGWALQLLAHITMLGSSHIARTGGPPMQQFQIILFYTVSNVAGQILVLVGFWRIVKAGVKAGG